jgi:hypothetical protein
MANTLGIPEVTLLEIVNPLTVENTVGVGSRLSVLEPLVVRLMGHDDDNAAATDDPDDMALFYSKAYGQPWVKEGSALKRVKFVAAETTTPCTVDATYIIPFYDYSTFE